MAFPALVEVVRGSAGYPPRLERLPVPPGRLWVAGQLPGAGPAVAIVGSRAASGAGCERARQLGRTLGRAGLAVVSGGAYGIDAAGHQGALDAGAVTFAVLGCGPDIVYPDRHAPLFRAIAASGGLMSEHAPGTKPRPGQFVTRNRIIAALVDAVIVVEAAGRSGALGTARLATQLSVPVLACPGTAGTDYLIDEGAHPINGAAEVLAFLRAVAEGNRPRRARPRVCDQDVSAGRLGQLREALAGGPVTADRLAHRMGCTVAEVLGRLGQAEIEGWIRRLPGGTYEVTRGH